jgi:hypothetical protein
MTLTVDIDGLLFISSWKLLQKSKRPYFKRTCLKFIQYSFNTEFAEPVFLPRFVLHGTEFRVVFSSAEWFGTEFREFASSSSSIIY